MTTAFLPEAPWRHRPGFDTLCAQLGADNGGVRLVGGAVRDGMLGIDVSDIDLATRLLPEEVTERLTAAGIKVVPTGIAHGTVTAIIHHRPVEITTLRRDVSTDGRRATIVYTGDWREDAARRDFTINALYADPGTGAVYDYFGGLDDLAGGRVRFIGDPRQRIAEDHLRILRFFRFLARFGRLPPDADGFSACVDMANSLMALSRERVADEMMKLLALPDPAEVVRLMIEGGILAPVLPEIRMDGLDRLRALLQQEASAGISGASPLLRLAALLPPDAAIGDMVASRLKLSNKARKRIAAALTRPLPHKDALELAFRAGKETAIDQILLGQAPGGADAVRAVERWPMPEFPVGGRDLIELGVDPGPPIARLLSLIREDWIAEGFPDRDRALALAADYASQFRRESQQS